MAVLCAPDGTNGVEAARLATTDGDEDKAAFRRGEEDARPVVEGLLRLPVRALSPIELDRLEPE